MAEHKIKAIPQSITWSAHWQPNDSVTRCCCYYGLSLTSAYLHKPEYIVQLPAGIRWADPLGLMEAALRVPGGVIAVKQPGSEAREQQPNNHQRREQPEHPAEITLPSLRSAHALLCFMLEEPNGEFRPPHILGHSVQWTLDWGAMDEQISAL